MCFSDVLFLDTLGIFSDILRYCSQMSSESFQKVLRYAQNVLRCSQIFSDVLRYSQTSSANPQIFSEYSQVFSVVLRYTQRNLRCSQNILRIFSDILRSEHFSEFGDFLKEFEGKGVLEGKEGKRKEEKVSEGRIKGPRSVEPRGRGG